MRSLFRFIFYPFHVFPESFPPTLPGAFPSLPGSIPRRLRSRPTTRPFGEKTFYLLIADRIVDFPAREGRCSRNILIPYTVSPRVRSTAAGEPRAGVKLVFIGSAIFSPGGICFEFRAAVTSKISSGIDPGHIHIVNIF